MTWKIIGIDGGRYQICIGLQERKWKTSVKKKKKICSTEISLYEGEQSTKAPTNKYTPLTSTRKPAAS